MRKAVSIVGVLAAFTFFVVASMVATPVEARDWYGIGSLGKGDTTRSADAFQLQGGESGVNVYQLGIGYKLGDRFAVEGLYHGAEGISYNELCTFDPKTGKSTCVGDRTEVEPTGGSLSLVAGVDVGGFRPYARFGAFHGDSTSWIAGIGVQVSIVRLEYQHIDEVETGLNGFSSDMDILTLGVVF